MVFILVLFFNLLPCVHHISNVDEKVNDGLKSLLAELLELCSYMLDNTDVY